MQAGKETKKTRTHTFSVPKGYSIDIKPSSLLPSSSPQSRELVSKFRDVSIEFYVVSGGLQDVIGGSRVVQEYIDGFYGCVLGEADDGVVR